MTDKPLPPSILPVFDGSSIAYHKFAPVVQDETRPGVVFCGGFRSDMEGTKALALETYCRAKNIGYIRFDYFGHGQSSGDFVNGSIGRWKQDVLAVLDALTSGSQILVGSSMGGWLALLAALERKNIVGLVGIAAAPDFTEDLMWNVFDDHQKKDLLQKGRLDVPTAYDDQPYVITKKLIEEGRDHLLLGAPIDLHMPVRLVHGTDDTDVPPVWAEKIAEKITGDDVKIDFVEKGDHRLSQPHEIDRIIKALEDVLRCV